MLWKSGNTFPRSHIIFLSRQPHFPSFLLENLVLLMVSLWWIMGSWSPFSVVESMLQDIQTVNTDKKVSNSSFVCFVHSNIWLFLGSLHKHCNDILVRAKIRTIKVRCALWVKSCLLFLLWSGSFYTKDEQFVWQGAIAKPPAIHCFTVKIFFLGCSEAGDSIFFIKPKLLTFFKSYFLQEISS